MSRKQNAIKAYVESTDTYKNCSVHLLEQRQQLVKISNDMSNIFIYLLEEQKRIDDTRWMSQVERRLTIEDFQTSGYVEEVNMALTNTLVKLSGTESLRGMNHFYYKCCYKHNIQTPWLKGTSRWKSEIDILTRNKNKPIEQIKCIFATLPICGYFTKVDVFLCYDYRSQLKALRKLWLSAEATILNIWYYKEKIIAETHYAAKLHKAVDTISKIVLQNILHPDSKHVLTTLQSHFYKLASM